MAMADLPGRVFLDTSTVNFILDHGEEIFEGVQTQTAVSQWVRDDINALYSLFLVGTRAHWQMAISAWTYREIMSTNNDARRHHKPGSFSCGTIGKRSLKQVKEHRASLRAR